MRELEPVLAIVIWLVSLFAAFFLLALLFCAPLSR